MPLWLCCVEGPLALGGLHKRLRGAEVQQDGAAFTLCKGPIHQLTFVVAATRTTTTPPTTTAVSNCCIDVHCFISLELLCYFHASTWVIQTDNGVHMHSGQGQLTTAAIAIERCEELPISSSNRGESKSWVLSGEVAVADTCCCCCCLLLAVVAVVCYLLLLLLSTAHTRL